MKENRFESILNYIGLNEQEHVTEDEMNSVIDSLKNPDVSYAQEILDVYDGSEDMTSYFITSLNNCIRAGNINGTIGLLHLKGASMSEKFSAGSQAHLYNIKLYRGEPNIDENAPEEVKRRAIEEGELFRDPTKAKEAEQQHFVFEQARKHYVDSIKKNLEKKNLFRISNSIKPMHGEVVAGED